MPLNVKKQKKIVYKFSRKIQTQHRAKLNWAKQLKPDSLFDTNVKKYRET